MIQIKFILIYVTVLLKTFMLQKSKKLISKVIDFNKSSFLLYTFQILITIIIIQYTFKYILLYIIYPIIIIIVIITLSLIIFKKDYYFEVNLTLDSSFILIN